MSLPGKQEDHILQVFGLHMGCFTIFLLNPSVELRAMNGYMSRTADPDLDLLAIDFRDDDFNVITHTNGLPDLSCENQHTFSAAPFPKYSVADCTIAGMEVLPSPSPSEDTTAFARRPKIFSGKCQREMHVHGNKPLSGKESILGG